MFVTSLAVITSASAPLIIMSTSNLTPDKKWELLFDVGRTLEIPMEDFNEEWWPLVSNIWTKWNLYNYVNSNTQKTFTCYFMKYCESSTWQKEMSQMKNAK